MEKLTDERTAKWESVLLLGNPQTVDAARTWHRRVWQVELFARGQPAAPGERDAVLAEVIVDRARFDAAARHDLGVTSGQIPPGDPWEAPLIADPEPPAAP